MTKLQRRQFITVGLLFAGYSSYYFCRADLAVAMPLLADELRGHGMSAASAMVRLGTISSLGVLAYALGKLMLTGLGDLWGGRRSFLSGMGGAIVFTLLFAAGGGIPVFTLAWIGNRLTQSIGWAGLIKVCSKWFDFRSYGTVAGILSLSFLIGDAAARQSMGKLLQLGFGWRALFWFASGVASLLLLLNMFFLRESRHELGFSEPEVNPLNVFAGAHGRPKGMRAILRPLLTSRLFLIVCFLSLGCTLVRETFNTWTVTYLHDYFGFSNAAAAGDSSVFPYVGAASVLLTGWAGDRLGSRGRSLVMTVGLAITTIAVAALATLRGNAAHVTSLGLIGVAAFGLLGPYSYLAGAIALDFGGREASSSSSGLVDGVGYLGSVVSGNPVAHLAVNFGWRGVFFSLALIAAMSSLAASKMWQLAGAGLRSKFNRAATRP